MKLTIDEKISVGFLKFLKDNQLELGNDFTIVEIIPATGSLKDEQMEWEVVKGRPVKTSFYKVTVETTIYGFIGYGRLLERFYGSSNQS